MFLHIINAMTIFQKPLQNLQKILQKILRILRKILSILRNIFNVLQNKGWVSTLYTEIFFRDRNIFSKDILLVWKIWLFRTCIKIFFFRSNRFFVLFVSGNKLLSKEIAYADDFTVAGLIKSIAGIN